MNTIKHFPADVQGHGFEPTIPAEHARATVAQWHGVEAERLIEQLERPGPPPSIAPRVTAPGLLGRARETMEQRAREYDRPGGERSVAAVVAALNAILDRPALTETEGWLFMRLLKDVRMFAAPGYHDDSAVDGVAYQALMAESRSREGGR